MCLWLYMEGRGVYRVLVGKFEEGKEITGEIHA
jgi:hypothetical protein